MTFPPTYLQASSGALPIPGTSVGSLPTLTQIRLLVSAADDERRLRTIASNAIVRVSHMLIQDRNARYVVNEWDYQLDPAREVDPAQFDERSLLAVEQCELVVAVIGRTVGETTRKEVRHVYELRSTGRHRELWLFAHKRPSDPPTATAALHQLVAEIQKDFGRKPMYHPVRSELDFQASLMIQLIPYVLERAGLLAAATEGSAQ